MQSNRIAGQSVRVRPVRNAVVIMTVLVFSSSIVDHMIVVLFSQEDEIEVELPWGMRGPREGEVAAFLAAHLATRGLTCLLVVDDLWDR